MTAHQNSVFEAILPFALGFAKTATPEAVLFGYARLLLLDNSVLEEIIPKNSSAEIDDARKEFEKHKLDLKLIRSGFSLFSIYLASEESAKTNASIFNDYIENCSGIPESKEIIAKAIELCVLPLSAHFSVGCSMDDVFQLKKSLKSQLQGNQTAEQKSENITPAEKPKEAPKPEPVTPKETPDDFGAFANRYRKLTGTLLKTVKGQDLAVTKFVRGCFQGELLKNRSAKDHPRSSFFFFGPPGVGKTLLAKTAAEAIERPYTIFNMSEFGDPQSTNDLVGISRMYQNAQEGILTKFVKQNPECVLIFDEIEKASGSVLRLFLQILGSATLHDLYTNKDVSFADAIIIFTSNAGKSLFAEKKGNLTQLPSSVLVDALKNEKGEFGQQLFPPELCSRIASGNTILFNHLSVQYLSEMVQDSFDEFIREMKDEYDCDLTYTPSLPLLFMYSFGQNIDARIATAQSQVFIKNEVFELIRQLDSRQLSSNIRSMNFGIDLDTAPKEIRSLFIHEKKQEVLVFADAKIVDLFKDSDTCTVYGATAIRQASDILKKDIRAVFVDPLLNSNEANRNILSITDYNTEGIRFFHKMVDEYPEIPVYILNEGENLSPVDQQTFILEGAMDTVPVNKDQASAFASQLSRLLEDLYMETENAGFIQKGWVIDYKTRQDLTLNDGSINIVFYDLQKKQAIDAESRRSILSSTERPDVKFSDVIGAANAKSELQYYIRYLRNPREFMKNGSKPPKGILLYGPPGTGKTMLARAMAGESDVTFIQTSASEFKNKFVGESEANIRRLFARARKYAPAIIFIDEIDAIGRQRNGQDPHTESMLNALLTEIDGFNENSRTPVFVLAATNYGITSSSDSLGALDEALLRRFDNRIKVDLPNRNERLTYIDQYLNRMNAEISADVRKNIADRTTGQSLAIIRNIIDLAYRNSIKNETGLTDHDLLESLEEYMYGEKNEYTPEYYRSVAIHETGHAFVSWLTGSAPSYITIESRGDFGGYMQPENSEDVPNYTRNQLLDKICIALAGRAAEQVFFGSEAANNTGASSDLQKATNTAFHIICTYGMEENQLIVLSREEIMRSPVADKYIQQVTLLLQQQMAKTVKMIEDNKDIIEKIADVLIQENHLTGARFTELVKTLFTEQVCLDQQQ